MQMSLRKISDRFQVALPVDAAQSCGCHVGDYVDVVVKRGMIILKPVAIIAKDQEYFYTREWQEKVKQSEEEYKKGHYKSFKDVDSLVHDLHKKED